MTCSPKTGPVFRDQAISHWFSVGNTNYRRIGNSPYNKNRRALTIQELAEYFEVHRHTMANRIAEYKKIKEFDLFDAFSLLDFVRWYIQTYE